jgi:hypothetical protein
LALENLALRQQLAVWKGARSRMPGAGIVEDDHPHGMSVAPEVLVVLLKGLADVSQAVRGNDEEQVFGLHELPHPPPVAH